jgi:hypothetical protein
MEKYSIEMITRALNDHQVKYLIAGGLAVVAHGYVRFTIELKSLAGRPQDLMDIAQLRKLRENCP